MTIGIIADPLDRQYAGIHVYTRALITHLAGDPDVEVICIRPYKGEKMIGTKDIIVRGISRMPGNDILRRFFLIPRALRRAGCDVVIEPAHFGPFSLPRAIRRVTVIHDLTPLLFPGMHTFLGWFLQKLFLPRIIRRADLVVTNSQYTAQDIVKHIGIDQHKIVVAHLGVDEHFRRDPCRDVVAKYGIVRPYILYLGTIEPRKNLVRLIQAYDMYRVAHPGPAPMLVLAGKKGWQYAAVEEARKNARHARDIIFAGYIQRADLPALYSCAEVFVYPSLYEGFGLPVLEALACGTKVVTSDSSSLPEVGGRFAQYADPQDPAAIASTLKNALSDDAWDAEAAMAYAHEYTWDKMGEEIAEALDTRFSTDKTSDS